MSLHAIFTVVGAGLIVAALATYLVAIAVLLLKASSKLKAISASLATVAERVEPLEPIINEINDELVQTRTALKDVVEKAKAKQGQGGSGDSEEHDERSGIRRIFERARTALRE